MPAKTSAPLTAGTQRLAVTIRGAVQGVGFRPFVYRLAAELALTGWVINDSRGVHVEVEGDSIRLAAFLDRIVDQAPPHARIIDVVSDWQEPVGYTNFEIRQSDDHGAKTVFVLPDLATCPDCLADVLDPANRRHRYPFTNCTNCGPRFTIVEALPYDRPNTTMRGFTLCPACRREYEDPGDRRFHAQPNACPVCGPQLTLLVRSDNSLPPRRNDAKNLPEADAIHNSQFTIHNSQLFPSLTDARGSDDLAPVAALLHAGAIVAIKGLGGFHIMANARSEEAVQHLREQKPRRDKPFAVMARDLAQVHELCHLAPGEEALLTSAQAPIVLLRRRDDAPLAAAVAPGNPNLGVMLPYTPLHHLLLREVDFPLVATSGNLSDEPICTDNDEAVARLGHIVDAFLMHDRPIARHVDDSVIWLVDGQPQFLRRARGYAPLPVQLPQAAPTILAVGAHLKNTVALSVERQVFISQHIGDLESAEALAAFERVIADFLRLYAATPLAIAHDLHPDYLSTRWAIEQVTAADRTTPGGAWRDEPHSAFRIPHSAFHISQSLIPVQHHHAHLAACLADNGVPGPALGIIWDGTGYGPDGTIWGGEFLLGDAAGYRRVAHLRPFQLPGGDAAVREPRRVALALLWAMAGDAILGREDLAPIRDFAPTERLLLAQMLRRGVNTPVTTSAGRLFDGVAALLGLHQVVCFEGQAAMALEFACAAGIEDGYPFPLVAIGGAEPGYVLDWQPLLAALLDDLKRGVDGGIMATRFHNAAVAGMVAVAQTVGEPVVALSGGCFQNRRLTEQAAARLRKAGFQVLLHRQVPPNDGGISLGQVAVAARTLHP